MLRKLLLFAFLLGLFSATDAVAAPLPKGKILPGSHRPVYKRYGHHGLFERGLFSGFRGKGPGRASGVRIAKKHRGTL